MRQKNAMAEAALMLIKNIAPLFPAKNATRQLAALS